MIYILKKLRQFFEKESFKFLIYILLLLVSCLLILPNVEPTDSDLTKPPNIVWWFIVTITTVGYGDISPISTTGKLLAGITMVSGIGLGAGLISIISNYLLEVKMFSKRGLHSTTLKDHVVIFGYHKRDTEHLIEEIKLDRTYKNIEIVLCADLKENPLTDAYTFISGVPHSEDVLTRSSAVHAKHIIINCQNDQENILIALAVQSLNSQAHVVVYISDPENIKHIERINSQFSVVNFNSTPLIVQEMQDRGTIHIFHELLSNQTGVEIYKKQLTDISERTPFHRIFAQFKENHNATVIAIETDTIILNPEPTVLLNKDDSIFFISDSRI